MVIIIMMFLFLLLMVVFLKGEQKHLEMMTSMMAMGMIFPIITFKMSVIRMIKEMEMIITMDCYSSRNKTHSRSFYESMNEVVIEEM